MADVVETFSGHTYAQRPRAFFWQGERQEIEVLLAQERTPEGHRFRVRTSDGRQFALHYDEASDAWQISPA